MIFRIKGTLTTKRAAHVPVIRRWKLVFERREFGTQVENFEQDIVLAPINEGTRIPINRDIVAVFRARTNGTKAMVTVQLEYQGVPVSLPKQFEVNIATTQPLTWYSELYKGVKIQASVEVVAA